jgi:hypothetical protein
MTIPILISSRSQPMRPLQLFPPPHHHGALISRRRAHLINPLLYSRGENFFDFAFG